jgi:hypothetical protein
MDFKDYYKIQKDELTKTHLPHKYLMSVKSFVDKWKNHPKNSLLLNVGVDVHNFYPLSFQEILVYYYQWKRNIK